VSVVDWHDVECGGYEADLPVWRELARAEPGPVLDVGAGSGRVALDLARAGHDVTALDFEPALLAAAERRARDEGLTLTVVAADAASFELGTRRFGLILVPMQTIQLLRGAAERAGFFGAARRHLAPSGLVALAIAEALESFEEELFPLPEPDTGERDGFRFLSHPVAVREHGDTVRLERVRQTIAPDGSHSAEGDVIELTRLTAAELEAEGAATGLAPLQALAIPTTDAHVGATVVRFRG